MKDYEINKNTLALIPIGKKKTVIYEDHECFIVDEKILKIMDSNCKYYGSSISGRIQGTYSLTGFNYKAPIIVEEDKSIIFFPTCSPRLKDCAWINVNNIKKVHSKSEKSIIEFLNNEKSLKEKNRKEQKPRTNKYFCIECGKPVSNKNSRCNVCYKQFCAAKSSKPEREVLKDKIKTMSFTQIGKEYNVTDNAIRKWCKSYNLPYRVKDIQEIIKKGEWENI